MNMIEQHLDKLGYKCKDQVTGLEGVITSISFDLYGCVQAIVSGGMKEDGTLKESLWFDIARLEITSDKPVMQQPDFQQGYIAEGKKGPAEKPVQNKY